MIKILWLVLVAIMIPVHAKAACWFPALGCPPHKSAHHIMHVRHRHHTRHKVVIIKRTIVEIHKTIVHKEDDKKPKEDQKPIRIEPIK